jgi:hypothetical protein
MKATKMTHICSVNAADDLKEALDDADAQLQFLTTELQRYRALLRIHYGHVGDIKHIAAKLYELGCFLLEDGQA